MNRAVDAEPRSVTVSNRQPRGSALQRKCACSEKSGTGGVCPECEKRKLRRRVAGESPVASIPPIVHEVLREPGTPLEPTARGFFESGFGHSFGRVRIHSAGSDAQQSGLVQGHVGDNYEREADRVADRILSASVPSSTAAPAGAHSNLDFSKVRVHTDSKAAESAKAVDALAYTVGSDVVFARGQYSPGTADGRRLLAHELTHVVQQTGSTSERDAAPDNSPGPHPLNRFTKLPGAMLQTGKGKQCKGGQCAETDKCALPDPGRDGGGKPSTDRVLDVNIDIEASSWEDALVDQEFGHTYVRLEENNGREYTYGFYPRKDLPNENRRSVPGCVNHPDRTHDRCIDERVTFTLSEEQYESALAKAAEICRNPKDYGQTYTCNSFAHEIAAAAKQTLPSSASKPTTVYYQSVPSIENPNTLLENVREARKKGTLKTPRARYIERARQLIGFIKIGSMNSHALVFSELNSLSMDDMLKLLTEINRQKMLQPLFDFFGAAQGVYRDRLLAALTAVKVKSAGGSVPPADIDNVLNIAPNLPTDQKDSIRQYLK